MRVYNDWDGLCGNNKITDICLTSQLKSCKQSNKKVFENLVFE